ncbi:MAG: TerB family tellurite resistance protein [Alphaproteobacteria bacterium]|nr:TerB family tellurite resistance protein [Alphaproteobacteria bacterium]
MTIPARKSWWGKAIGSVLGLWAGGPVGAAVGFIVGHIHDTRPPANDQQAWSGLWGHYGDFAANVEQAAFTMGVVVLGAKMAKADGRVTREEIEAFKRVFHIRPDQEAAVGRLFDRARLSADGFEPYAFQLAHIFRRNAAVLEEVLSGLFIIAAADSHGLSRAETVFLKRVAFIFGFGSEDLARIAARSGVHMPGPDMSSSSGSGYRAPPPPNPSAEAFAILGVSETATVEEIKASYRALIREHHPDKLMAQGVPPEFIATATEKMKRINVAYDTVCRIKGIK